MVVCGDEASSARQCGIRAFEIALSGASSRLPKPSRISSTTGRTAGLTAGAGGGGSGKGVTHAKGAGAGGKAGGSGIILRFAFNRLPPHVLH